MRSNMVSFFRVRRVMVIFLTTIMVFYILISGCSLKSNTPIVPSNLPEGNSQVNSQETLYNLPDGQGEIPILGTTVPVKVQEPDGSLASNIKVAVYNIAPDTALLVAANGEGIAYKFVRRDISQQKILPALELLGLAIGLAGLSLTLDKIADLSGPSIIEMGRFAIYFYEGDLQLGYPEDGYSVLKGKCKPIAELLAEYLLPEYVTSEDIALAVANFAIQAGYVNVLAEYPSALAQAHALTVDATMTILDSQSSSSLPDTQSMWVNSFINYHCKGDSDMEIKVYYKIQDFQSFSPLPYYKLRVGVEKVIPIVSENEEGVSDSIQVHGNFLGHYYGESVELEVTNSSSHNVYLLVPAGLTFKPYSESQQTLISYNTKLQLVKANSTERIRIKAACINPSLGIPYGEVALVALPEDQNLIKLTKVINYHPMISDYEALHILWDYLGGDFSTYEAYFNEAGIEPRLSVKPLNIHPLKR